MCSWTGRCSSVPLPTQASATSPVPQCRPDVARMCPPAISADVRSGAERRLFDQLRDGLPETWTVLHSLGVMGHRTKAWAEIDFVLVGPSGVYCFEVQRGRGS